MHLIKLNDDAMRLLPTNGARSFVTDKFMGRTIRLMDSDTLIDEVMDLISKGHRNLGHLPAASNKDQLIHTAKQIISAILNAKEFKKGRTTYDFRNTTIEELDKAITEYTLGAYKKKVDEVLMVSASTVMYAVECYLTQDSRVASLNYYNLLLAQPAKKADPTEEQQQYLIQKGLEGAINKFKEEGEFPSASSCHVFYRHMKKRGELILTEEARVGYLANAKTICEKAVKDKRGKMTPAAYKEAFEKIGTGNSIKLKAMELAFKDYLTNLPPTT